MAKELKQKGVATFQGFTVGATGQVTIKFKFRYDEVVTSVNLLQGLNNDITVIAKVPDKKSMNLGMFTIGGINFDKDGNAVIPFKSLVDSVNMENICAIVDAEYVQLMFKAIIELPAPESEEEGGSEEWDD